jgi:hypothetical protein
MTMNRTALGVVALTALVTSSLACGSTSSTSSTPATPVAPSPSSTGLNDAVGGAGGSSLKASAPVAQSPNNVSTPTLTPTFVVAGGGLMFASGAVQYRIRVVDTVGTIAADSGLVSGGTWTPSAPLTPTTKYTWMARSEYQGLNGQWSTAATFTTPVAPGNDYGAWESTCQGVVANREALVGCVWNFVRPTNSVQDLEVVKRVAWLLRGVGGGLLLKGSGENTVPWLSQTFSASRVCFPDGHIYKIIGDAGPGGANSPAWGDNDFVDPSSYVAAMDPRLR